MRAALAGLGQTNRISRGDPEELVAATIQLVDRQHAEQSLTAVRALLPVVRQHFEVVPAAAVERVQAVEDLRRVRPDVDRLQQAGRATEEVLDARSRRQLTVGDDLGELVRLPERQAVLRHQTRSGRPRRREYTEGRRSGQQLADDVAVHGAGWSPALASNRLSRGRIRQEATILGNAQLRVARILLVIRGLPIRAAGVDRQIGRIRQRRPDVRLQRIHAGAAPGVPVPARPGDDRARTIRVHRDAGRTVTAGTERTRVAHVVLPEVGAGSVADRRGRRRRNPLHLGELVVRGHEVTRSRQDAEHQIEPALIREGPAGDLRGIRGNVLTRGGAGQAVPIVTRPNLGRGGVEVRSSEARLRQIARVEVRRECVRVVHPREVRQPGQDDAVHDRERQVVDVVPDLRSAGRAASHAGERAGIAARDVLEVHPDRVGNAVGVRGVHEASL